MKNLFIYIPSHYILFIKTSSCIWDHEKIMEPLQDWGQKEVEFMPRHRGGTAQFIVPGIIVLAVIIGSVIILSGTPPQVVWEGAPEGARAALPAAVVESILPQGEGTVSPPAGARVLEGGKYVTYVYFTGHAFVPAEVTIAAGEGVRFVDVSNLSMRVGSRPESLSSVPYSALAEAKAQGKGSSFVITLGESGVWSYENLTSKDPRVFGTVYVR